MLKLSIGCKWPTIAMNRSVGHRCLEFIFFRLCTYETTQSKIELKTPEITVEAKGKKAKWQLRKQRQKLRA